MIAVLIVIGILAISRITDILMMIFIAFILSAAINPFVDHLEKLHINRGIAIIIIYLILWLIIGGILASIIPALVDQTAKLIKILPSALTRIEFFNLHQQEISQQILSRLGTLPENLVKITIGIFGNLLSIFTTMVISFYLLLYHRRLESGLFSQLGIKNISQVERRLGDWVRGELLLMFAVTVLTYIGLSILGIDIALPLAILAGLLEIIPNIGPTLSAIPAVLISLTLSPFLTFATIALYVIVQAIENHILVPRIMQSAVGVNPLVSIIGLMVGFRLAGPAGAILAIPIIITLEILIPQLKKFSLEESKPDSV